LRQLVDAAPADVGTDGGPLAPASSGDDAGLERIGDVPVYSADALVRRAGSLQETPDALAANVARVCAAQADRSGLGDADSVQVVQGDCAITIALEIDERVPPGCVWLPSATPAAAGLGPGYGRVTLERD